MKRYEIVTEVRESFDTEEEARAAFDAVRGAQIDRDDETVRTVSLFCLEEMEDGTTMRSGMEHVAKGASGFRAE